MTSLALNLLERDWLPDALIRFGIRRLLAERLREERKADAEAQQAHLMRFVEELRASPVAIATREANEQHYEVPSEFFQRVLGKHLKYSSCYYAPGVTSLDEAEAKMLALTCERAQLRDGEDILELGCGWGSLTLWMAAHFPNARITAVSNSRTQKQFIDARAAERGLRNVEVITCDANVLDFPAGRTFDRVVSVEMFEHMRNYGLLLAKLSRWLNDDGQLFVHIFAHRHLAYFFEDREREDWMTRYFFSGGIMPSETLLANFQDHLVLTRQWWVDGRHYEKTSNHWLAGMDASRHEIMALFRTCYGHEQAAIWFQRWRMFYMAVAELFGYDHGREWGVGHYLFSKR